MLIATMLAALFTATTPVAEPARQVTTPVTTTPRVKRYCIIDRREGSLQRGKTCRTRGEWRARGLDPLLILGKV